MNTKVKEIKLDEEKAVAKVWNKEHKAWFFLIPDDTIGCISGYLKYQDKLYISSSLTSAPWLWGRMITKKGEKIDYKMDKECLLKSLKKLKGDIDDKIYQANDLFLQFIEDKEISESYRKYVLEKDND